MTISDWRTCGFTKHGNRGDSRRAQLSRATAFPISSSKRAIQWEQREAKLTKKLANAQRQQKLLEQEVASLKKQLAETHNSAAQTTTNEVQDLCSHLHTAISERDAARDQVLREQQRVAKCKAAYAALAQKYNHLLAHHVRKTQPKIDAYGTNMSKAEAEALAFEELDEQVNQDIGHASATGLAKQLGIFDSSCPSDPLALFAHT
jgi:chromosome segregation ATPase